MEQNNRQMLFALLRTAICAVPLSEEQKCGSKDAIADLSELSAKHGVEHLVALGLKQNNLFFEYESEIKKCIFRAAYQYEQLFLELNKLCSALEYANIPFMPLKGSVLRKYYPEPWMRTSCDIDILVREEDLDKAIAVLVEKYAYTYHGKSSHDVSLFSPRKMHIELHYQLVEEGLAMEASTVLESVWNTAILSDSSCCQYEMSDEMFYFYHVAHMAKHFENGGCGIRPIADLWLLDNVQGVDHTRRNELLQQGKLLRFAEAVRKLSRIWFENAPMDPISQKIEDYILQGGLYGSFENRVTLQRQRKGGKIRYALSKIFIPYDVIKFYYPVLQKYRWLTPVMEICRWVKLVFCGHRIRVLKELSYNEGITEAKANEMMSFLDEIGL